MWVLFECELLVSAHVPVAHNPLTPYIYLRLNYRPSACPTWKALLPQQLWFVIMTLLAMQQIHEHTRGFITKYCRKYKIQAHGESLRTQNSKRYNMTCFSSKLMFCIVKLWAVQRLSSVDRSRARFLWRPLNMTKTKRRLGKIICGVEITIKNWLFHLSPEFCAALRTNNKQNNHQNISHKPVNSLIHSTEYRQTEQFHFFSRTTPR